MCLSGAVGPHLVENDFAAEASGGECGFRAGQTPTYYFYFLHGVLERKNLILSLPLTMPRIRRAAGYCVSLHFVTSSVTDLAARFVSASPVTLMPSHSDFMTAPIWW